MSVSPDDIYLLYFLLNNRFTDSTEMFSGCPVGLQLIGRSQEEEAVIAMTEIVDDALRAARCNL